MLGKIVDWLASVFDPSVSFERVKSSAQSEFSVHTGPSEVVVERQRPLKAERASRVERGCHGDGVIDSGDHRRTGDVMVIDTLATETRGAIDVAFQDATNMATPNPMQHSSDAAQMKGDLQHGDKPRAAECRGDRT